MEHNKEAHEQHQVIGKTYSSYSTPSSVDASSLPSSAVASIIHSAAKVSLFDQDEDDNVENKLFPDNEYEEIENAASLHSLRKASLPALPDELDRKRFLGCLASILATMYSFDTASEPEEDTTASEGSYQVPGLDDDELLFQTDFFTDSPPRKKSEDGSPPRRRGINHVEAQERHRKRRYRVYCAFLASSAQLLKLDEGQGKCFLPMLATLLAATKPEPKPSDHSKSFLRRQVDQIEHLQSFLDDMSPGAGIRCLTLFLVQHLLHSPKGYDARIRVALRKLGVLVLMHDMILECGEESKQFDLSTMAARKFEALEEFIAGKLIELSQAQVQKEAVQTGHHPAAKANTSSSGTFSSRDPNSDSSRQRLIRGLKIGGTAVAAGTLFAITGGLAAPGIAAGVAAITAGTTATAVVAATALLTSTAAVTAIFGVGGGGLVAYKMQRRIAGLSEFEFTKETSSEIRDKKARRNENFREKLPDADLFSTICVSGWLRDDCDFQRPWGVEPWKPPIYDLEELLERFYHIHKPANIPRVKQILENWKGEERQLWSLLRKHYGTDPSCLFPLSEGNRFRGSLSLEEVEVASKLLTILGYSTESDREPSGESQETASPIDRMKQSQQRSNPKSLLNKEMRLPSMLDESEDSDSDAGRSESSSKEHDRTRTHLATVWDYQANYGGEMYTLRWESKLLEELCDSVADLATDIFAGATAHFLKFTALSTLVTAVAWPASLLVAANLIDGSWTLAVQRADAAGKELAQSLLFSTAGNRPVTLVGFSFGARVIYSCLKELAKAQQEWEDYHENGGRDRRKRNRRRKDKERQEKIDLAFSKMREPASIVGDAVLLGLPNHLSLSSWKSVRQVVSGRVVNCFSQRDLILHLMFQIKKFGLKPVCGTCPVNVHGVENVDVTDLVGSRHQEYCFCVQEILKRVRLGEPFPSESNGVLLDIDSEGEETS